MPGKVYKVNGLTNQIMAGVLQLLPRSVFYALGHQLDIIPTE